MTESSTATTECTTCKYTSGHWAYCPEARETIEITAGELHPGDVVLHKDNTRWFAAFDVSAPAGPGDGGVRVWTAIADQEAGEPPVRDLDPNVVLVVSRRLGGPRTTRVSL